MKKLILVVVLELFVLRIVAADDAGGIVADSSFFSPSGGDMSGGIGGGSISNAINGANVQSGGGSGATVPSISPINSDSSMRLNLNNQQLLQNNYANMANGMNKGMMPVANGSGGYSYVPVVGGNAASNSIDEFQQNVSLRTGVNLPRYGYNQFSTPQSFATINNTPVDSNYTIGPGDQIVIQGWGMIDVNYTLEVDKDGTIFIPKVGKVSLVGVKANGLNDYLKSKLSKYYKDFSVSATVSQLRSIQIYVTGFASKPGTYQVSAISGLSNIIFQVGGPSNVGSLRNIQVKRDGVVVASYDMYNVLIDGDNSRDIKLLPGDVVYFPPVGNNVAIYDGVKLPAIYELKPNENIQDLVRFAGGFSFNGSHDKVVVEHIDDQKRILVHDYNYAKEGNRHVLKNGDIVHFFSMNNIYESSIILMGNVAKPSRYEYRPGMRISDVIPNKEMLLTKSFWDSYSKNTYAKDNILTKSGVEKTSNLAGSLSNDSSYSAGFSKGQKNTTNVFGASDNLFTAGPLSIPEANINWGYAAIVRIDDKSFSTHILPFNLAKAIAKDSKNDLELRPGDIINVLSTKDVRISSINSVKYVFIDGEIVAPGVYEMPPGSQINDVIKAAGGTYSTAYIYGIELDRVSVKKKQKLMLNQMLDQLQQSLLGQASNATTLGVSGGGTNIGIVLQQQQQFIDKLRGIEPNGRVVLGLKNGNATESDLPNIVVENGDTIYVPPIPSTVDIIGQVYNQSSTMYKPDYTVADYIKQAGGANQFADVSNIYIVHADGTLYSKASAGWFGGFDSRTINPGDTIIIPQVIQIGGLVQNVLNWTQILANFGMTAAAITVFK